MKNIFDAIIHGLELNQDNDEILFYWDKLFEDIEKYADPKYDPTSMGNHFYDIACGLSSAEFEAGFSQGVSFCMDFMAQGFNGARALTRQEARQQYRELERPMKEADHA